MADAIHSICTNQSLYEYLRDEGKKEVDGIVWEKRWFESTRIVRSGFKKVMVNINAKLVMKTICLYFEIHQIIHLKRYRFFEIGTDHYYYDDYANEQGINEVVERSYITSSRKLLIEMAKENEGMFKVALSISGVALEQLEIHAPAVIELLHETECYRML